MTTTEQIKACAELDGFIYKGRRGYEYDGEKIEWDLWTGIAGNQVNSSSIPNYLTSYDAIIPLIQKICKNRATYSKFADQLVYNSVADLLGETPAQLVEALLRACGKWKE